MKIFRVVFLLAAIGLPAFGQGVTVTASAIKSASSAPSSCNPNSIRSVNGSLYLGKNDGTCQNVGAASGTVIGPGSATDNAVVRFDSTTGTLVQNSSVLISDAGSITGASSVYVGTGTQSGIVQSAANTLGIAVGGANVWLFDINTLTVGSWAGGVSKSITLQTNAGNSNRASDFIQINASNGTGSGAAGAFIVRSGAVGSSGSAVHTLEETMRSYVITAGQAMFSLGGATSSFPALKRSSAEIQARLADDSAFAGVQSLYVRYGSGTPEGVVTAPVGAIYSRTDGGAGTSLYVKESGSGNTGWVGK